MSRTISEHAILWNNSTSILNLGKMKRSRKTNEYKIRMFPNLRVDFSMTTLLMHTVANSTQPSFMPKTNNQPPKKFLSLAHFLKTSIFKPLYFLKWRPIFDNFYSTERKTQKLFKWLVVGFGPKGMHGRMCDIVR